MVLTSEEQEKFQAFRLSYAYVVLTDDTQVFELTHPLVDFFLEVFRAPSKFGTIIKLLLVVTSIWIICEILGSIVHASRLHELTRIVYSTSLWSFLNREQV